MNKKAVLGLDTAKLFVLAILALVIISVVTLIVLDNIDDIQPNAFGGALSNATTSTVVNFSSSSYPTGLSSTNLDCVLTVSIMTNATEGTIIPATNYTITNCAIGCSSATGCANFNNTLWNVTGTYTKTSSSKIMVTNTSSALESLFADTGTWFTLIGVVIIILIIAVVIVVVNRMGVGSAFSGTPQTANI